MPLLGNVSLTRKLPVAIGALLAAGVGLYGVVTYRAIKDSLIAAADARLSGLARQIVELSLPAAAQRERRMHDVAANPAVVAALTARGGATAERTRAARTALAKLGPETGSLLAVELRDSAGATVVALTPRATGSVRRGPAVNDTATSTPLFAHGDSVFIEYRSAVMDGARVAGHVVQSRSALSSAASARGLLTLIGPDAAVLMGNADGSLWTDLLHLTQRPAPSRALERYERDGRSRLAVAVPYTGNPLVIAAELPEDAVLAPLRRLAWGLAGIAALIVAVGFGLGWWFSRDVSAPVARLTHAAEGIAGGNLTHVNVTLDRGDEIGRLSRAFAVMADHVRGTQDTLERQVAERTKALHEAQDELVKKERLAILGQLSSGVGHELRNPLGVMTNAVYFLEMTLPDAPKKAKDYLGILRAQIRLSEKIVSDLLDFARVKSPQRAIVPLAQLLEEPLGRVTVPEGVRVERDVPGGLPGAFVDQVQVGQVLLNLVTNAVQAMEETGGVLSLRASGRNGRVRLEVGDSGPGIAPENLTRIFEPLFTTKARGIGLGLSVSRLLAEANNGVLTARSEPGHGATFVLDLPAAQG